MIACRCRQRIRHSTRSDYTVHRKLFAHRICFYDESQHIGDNNALKIKCVGKNLFRSQMHRVSQLADILPLMLLSLLSETRYVFKSVTHMRNVNKKNYDLRPQIGILDHSNQIPSKSTEYNLLHYAFNGQ